MKKLASVSLLSIAALFLAFLSAGMISHASVKTQDKGITVQADGTPGPPPPPHGTHPLV